MKKAFKKYLFPLYVLLLVGFVNLYADSYTCTEQQIEPENAGYAAVDQYLNHIPIYSFQSGVEKRHHIEVTDIEEQEEKDKDVTSDNKYLQNGSHLAAFFYASMGHSSGKLERNLGLFRPFSIVAPLKRYIRFQVFRI